MKRIVIATMLLCFTVMAWAQTPKLTTNAKTPAQKDCTETKAKKQLYDEKMDAMKQIDMALEEARKTDRLVMCQVGGNWCPWCIRFAKFIEDNQDLAELVKKHFVYIHVNTSKANKNEEAMVRLGNPGRFGYPVLVILDHDGRVMHIQNSSYLEEEKSYNLKKVMEFFQNWTLDAIHNLK